MGCLYTVVSYFRETSSTKEQSTWKSTSSAVPSFLKSLGERNKQEQRKLLYTQIDAQEDVFHPYHDIISNDNYVPLLSYIAEKCPADTVSKWEKRYEEMKTYSREVEKVLENSVGVRLLLIVEKFEKIRAERKTLYELPLEQYCVQKYANTLYQQWLASVHHRLIVSTGILRDEQDMSGQHVIDMDAEKKNILEYIHARETKQTEHLSADEILEDKDAWFSVDDSVLDSLPKKEQQFSQLFITIAKIKILKTLALLEKQAVFSPEDILRLRTNISLVIPESCSTRDAHYYYLEQGEKPSVEEYHYHDLSVQHAIKVPLYFMDINKRKPHSAVYLYQHSSNQDVIEQDGRLIKFHGLSFSLPVCSSYINLTSFSQILEYTILHELGHYYMHRRDKNPSAFFSMCREEDRMVCAATEFVSEYAKLSPPEDYAETFANVVYKVLYGYGPMGEIPENKQAYFLDQFSAHRK
jgi:hypothetical protein